jgi:hypothetical protein
MSLWRSLRDGAAGGMRVPPAKPGKLWPGVGALIGSELMHSPNAGPSALAGWTG